MENRTSRNSETPRSNPLKLILILILVLGAFAALVANYIIKEKAKQEQRAKQLEEILTNKVVSKEENKPIYSDLSDIHLYKDSKSLQEGKNLFDVNCVACHKADGGGGIGPNHTDKYWINGGGFDNIYHTISEGGRPGKGMVPWKTNFKPVEIAKLASYVISLNGTSPAEPKDPEGDIIWTKDME